MGYFTKKPGSIEEAAAKLTEKDSEYQALFRKELDKEGKGIASMSPAEKTAFFNKIDKMYKAKDEQASKGEIDKFHKKLDNLVHKSFGHSSDEKKMKNEQMKITIIPKEGDKEARDAFEYLHKKNGNEVASYGIVGSGKDAHIEIQVPTSKVLQADKVMHGKKFGKYEVRVKPNRDLNKYEGVEHHIGELVNEASNPFELYQSIAGWEKASKEMEKELEKAKKMSDKKKARELMFTVQKKFAKYGATDTEANSEIRYQLGLAQGEEVNEKIELDEGFSSDMIKKAVEIAKTMGGNMTAAVEKIEKLAKGLSDQMAVKNALRLANESFELNELNDKNPEFTKLMKMYSQAMKMVPGSPRQKDMIKQINQQRLKAGLTNPSSLKEGQSMCPCCNKTEDNCTCAPDCPDCSCGGRPGTSNEEVAKLKEDVAKMLETHTFRTAAMNKSQKEKGGEKEVIKKITDDPALKKESVFDSIKSVWSKSADEIEKIQDEAQWLKSEGYKKKTNEDESEKEKKGTTDIGTKKTKVDVEPEVEYQ